MLQKYIRMERYDRKVKIMNYKWGVAEWRVNFF